MAASRLDLLDANYRLRIRHLRELTIALIVRAYGRIAELELGTRARDEITPAMAAAWLARRAVRSPLDEAKVARLMAAIISGRYRDAPGDPVQITPDGRLLNGIHRLTAVVRTGTAITQTVARDVPPAAVTTSFAAFLPIAARQLTAGQAQAQTLTRAYVVAAVSASTGSRIDPVRTPSLAGTTKGGIPPAESMAGIRPMILTAIQDGRTIEDAMGLGGYLVRRFTDNELSRVVDTEFMAQAERHAIGWRGIVHSPQDPCMGNAGVHPMSHPFYRHGGCRCERTVIFEGAA